MSAGVETNLPHSDCGQSLCVLLPFSLFFFLTSSRGYLLFDFARVALFVCAHAPGSPTQQLLAEAVFTVQPVASVGLYFLHVPGCCRAYIRYVARQRQHVLARSMRETYDYLVHLRFWHGRLKVSLWEYEPTPPPHPCPPVSQLLL